MRWWRIVKVSFMVGWEFGGKFSGVEEGRIIRDGGRVKEGEGEEVERRERQFRVGEGPTAKGRAE